MAIEEEASAKKNDAGISTSQVDPSAPEDGNSTEIMEELPVGHPWRRQNLALEIPSRTLEDGKEVFVRIDMPPTPSPTPKRVNFSPLPSPMINRISGSPGPSSSKTKSTIKNLLPKLSFKYRNSTLEIRKAATIIVGGAPTATREKPLISRTFSLTKLFTPRPKNTSSLPVTPIAHSNPESMHGRNTNDLKGERQMPIHRSHSVPVLCKDGSVSVGSVFRVIPTTPLAMERTVSITSCTSPKDDNDSSNPYSGFATSENQHLPYFSCGSDGSDDDREHIAEEEAVCRICFVELGEGADTLKMECSCKGELALAHQECAVKWFSIKGNRTCEVCKQDVQNLPVTLLRIQNVQAHNLRGTRAQQPEVTQYRVWQDVPILVIVSMLAYFCFLEQLLVGKMGSGAIALSLPFSCILGLLASMTATTMVKRKYVWVYASVQFSLVVLSAHLLYSLIHMQAVLSVLLATFTGFGVTMCGNSIIIEVLGWRERRRSRSNQQRGTPAVTQPNEPQQTQTNPQQIENGIQEHGSPVVTQPNQPQQTQTNPQQLENEIRGAEAIHGS